MSKARIYQSAGGDWVLWNGTTKSRYDTEMEAQIALGGVRAMEDKIAAIQVVRDRAATFIAAARQMQSALEDVELLGMMPDGDDPITPEEAAAGGLTVERFYTGMGALALLLPTPTPEQSAAIARLASR